MQPTLRLSLSIGITPPPLLLVLFPFSLLTRSTSALPLPTFDFRRRRLGQTPGHPRNDPFNMLAIVLEPGSALWSYFNFQSCMTCDSELDHHSHKEQRLTSFRECRVLCTRTFVSLVDSPPGPRWINILDQNSYPLSAGEDRKYIMWCNDLRCAGAFRLGHATRFIEKGK